VTQDDHFTPLNVPLDTDEKEHLQALGFRCFAQISRPYNLDQVFQIGQALRQYGSTTIIIIEGDATSFWAIPPADIEDRVTLTHLEAPVANNHPEYTSQHGSETSDGTGATGDIEALAPPLGKDSPIDARVTVRTGPPEGCASVSPETDDAAPLELKRRSDGPPPLPTSDSANSDSEDGIPVSTRHLL
jgi:hypothetical protein